MNLHVSKSSVNGTITVPGSKSHTMRALLFATMADGESHIHNFLPSPDTTAMIQACQAFGATVQLDTTTLHVHGTNGVLSTPDQVIDVGNSGQVLRFGAALASLLPHYTIFTGDASIRSLRPMTPLLDALTQAGAVAVSSKGDGYAPIIIRGPAKAAQITMDGQDSQPVSAMLMLSAFLHGTTSITVTNAGELPWIALTLHWLDALNISYTNKDFTQYTITGPTKCQGFDYTVPSDWSSAAFPLAAALVTQSSLVLNNMDIDDPQGDKAIVHVLQEMGARFVINKQKKTLTVLPHEGLSGTTIDANTIIDAVPILATIACFANSPTTITGAAIARHKECDRLSCIATELGKMGAHIEEKPDGLIIYPSTLHGALVSSHHDHRIAMSLAIAGLTCGNTTITESACIAKSFPGFTSAMQHIGAAFTTKE